MKYYITNYTCEVLCEAAVIASYHGRDPGYYGNILVPVTMGVGLGSLALVTGITVAKALKCFPRNSDTQAPRQEPRVWKQWISFAGKAASVIAIASFAAGLLDNLGLLPPGTKPSTQFRAEKLTDAIGNCFWNCTSSNQTNYTTF